jgi:hypothetical protein
MKYMLLITSDELAQGETKREECHAESVQFTHQLKSRGQLLPAKPLHLTSTAINVRVRNSKALVTDGPFVETREQLGG